MHLRYMIRLLRGAQTRIFSTTTITHTKRVDELVADISRQYETATQALGDAHESTSLNSVYAREDREVMKRELEVLVGMVEGGLGVLGGTGDLEKEFRNRVMGRVRELREGVGRVVDAAGEDVGNGEGGKGGKDGGEDKV